MEHGRDLDTASFLGNLQTMNLWGLSPRFWRKQLRVVVVFSLLCAYTTAASWKMEHDFIAQQALADDSQVSAREMLDEMRGWVSNAKAVRITPFKDHPLYSGIEIETKNGNRVAYYEREGALYAVRDGKTQKAIEDLVSAMFLPLYGKKQDGLFIEMQVWVSDSVAERLTTKIVSSCIRVPKRVIPKKYRPKRMPSDVKCSLW